MQAFDCSTVPALTFRVPYCFFILEHGRRKILHFHATAHPASEWIVQQLREAFPLPCPYRYVIFDRGSKSSPGIREFPASGGIKPVRTSIRGPWQNAIAERGVGSCRRELWDRVIPLHEEQLRRLGREYLEYCHEDCTHNGLGKPAPSDRPVQPRSRRKHRTRWQAVPRCSMNTILSTAMVLMTSGHGRLPPVLYDNKLRKFR